MVERRILTHPSGRDVDTRRKVFEMYDNFDPKAAQADRDKILGDMGEMATGYENTIATLRAELAASKEREAKLQKHLDRILKLEEYSFVLPNQATGKDNVKSTIAAFDEARRALESSNE